jgi:hypothetical protein
MYLLSACKEPVVSQHSQTIGETEGGFGVGNIVPGEAHNDRTCTTVIVFWLLEKLDDGLSYGIEVSYLGTRVRWGAHRA